MTTVTIQKVVSDRGLVIIIAQAALLPFFRRAGPDCSPTVDRLVGGERVTFEIEDSPKGPRASRVSAA
jgi:hypothetical protein